MSNNQLGADNGSAPLPDASARIANKVRAMNETRMRKQHEMEAKIEAIQAANDERRIKLSQQKQKNAFAASQRLNTFKSSITTNNNRGCALKALRTLSAQLRVSVKRNQKLMKAHTDCKAKLAANPEKYPKWGVDYEEMTRREEELEDVPCSLKELFDMLDTDCNGTLCRNEFLEGLQILNVDLNKEEIGLLWDLFDKNNDDAVDYAEFGELIEKDDIKNTAAGAMGPNQGPALYAKRKISTLALRRGSTMKRLTLHSLDKRKERIKTHDEKLQETMKEQRRTSISFTPKSQFAPKSKAISGKLLSRPKPDPSRSLQPVNTDSRHHHQQRSARSAKGKSKSTAFKPNAPKCSGSSRRLMRHRIGRRRPAADSSKSLLNVYINKDANQGAGRRVNLFRPSDLVRITNSAR